MPRFAPIAVPDSATYTVKAFNSGIPHMLPDLTADIVITLPAPKVGLDFEFWYAGAAADAQDWLIDTTSNTYFFKGGVVYVDTDAGDAADEVFTVMADGNSNSKLTVLTPQGGTWVRVYCDGTNWYVNGFVASTSASSAAFADQA